MNCDGCGQPKTPYTIHFGCRDKDGNSHYQVGWVIIVAIGMVLGSVFR